jgi:RNA polymerase sigma factor (sigma-70 family)
MDKSLQRIRDALTSRQIWLLSTRHPQSESLDGEPEKGFRPARDKVPDPAPDQEAALLAKERSAALGKAFRQLSKPDRLLITMRYDQNLTLQEIATLLSFKDVWAADRRIKQVLEDLRERVESAENFRTKTRHASV